jgi:riboflavin biosynthesis pyrimidine reductase
LFHSPKIVGANGINALDSLPLETLTQSPRLSRVSTEPSGPDKCDVFERR